MLPSDEKCCDAPRSPASSGARKARLPDAETTLPRVRAHVRAILLQLLSRELERPQQNP